MNVVLDFGEDRIKFKAFNYHYSLDVNNCREITLKPVDFSNAISLTTPPRLSVTSLVHSTNHSAVYRATDGDQLFVVKFALWSGTPANNLEAEVANYSKLSHLQGTVIPHFFGYYRTENEERFKDNKSRAISCIVLEDCGKIPCVPAWSYLAREPTYRVLDLVAKMHLEGHVLPNEFEPRNVVERDGVYRIIDLQDLSPHQCTFDGTYLAADGGPVFLLACLDIEELAWEANYWCRGEEQRKLDAELEDSWVWIGHSRFPEEYMPPQDVVDNILPSCITPSCAALRMFNGRLYNFFASVRGEHARRVADGTDISAEECPYTEEEIEDYRKWWKRCGLPTTRVEIRDQIDYYRFKKAELL